MRPSIETLLTPNGEVRDGFQGAIVPLLGFTGLLSFRLASNDLARTKALEAL